MLWSLSASFQKTAKRNCHGSGQTVYTPSCWAQGRIFIGVAKEGRKISSLKQRHLRTSTVSEYMWSINQRKRIKILMQKKIISIKKIIKEHLCSRISRKQKINHCVLWGSLSINFGELTSYSQFKYFFFSCSLHLNRNR